MNENDREFLVEKIRTQYTEKEYTQLDALKELDRKVKRPAEIFAYVFGSVGALVMGTGMSFALDAIEAGTYFGITVRENMMIPGVVLGIIGIAMAVVNYPAFKRILASRRKKYAAEIVRMSDEIMKGKQE